MIGTSFVFSNAILDFKKNVNWIFYLLFMFLFVAPVFFDYAIAFAGYTAGYWYGYAAVQEDYWVSIIYDIIIIGITGLFYYLLEIKYPVLETPDRRLSEDKEKLLFLVFNVVAFITPILFFVFAIFGRYNPLIIFKSSWRYLYEQSGSDYVGYGAVERLTYISIVCAVILIASLKPSHIFEKVDGKFNAKRIALYLLYLLALIGTIALCNLIEGKRSIILFTGAVFVFGLIFKLSKKIKLWMVIVGAVVIVGTMIPLAMLVAKGYRTSEDALANLRSYTSLRVDLFRDQSLKFAIYSAIHSKDISILRFPFQSYLTEVFFLFPLVYLPISFKCGYETYLTAAEMFCAVDELDTMRLTNSGIDEMVANFSFFGILVFAIVLWIFIKKMNKCSYIERVLLATAFLLFLMYTTSYVCWFYEFILGLYILFKLKNYITKRKQAKQIQKEECAS